MERHLSERSISRIKARRIELHLTQKELATRLGYSNYSIISLIEGGKRDISEKAINKWASALETTPEYLLLKTDDPTDFDFIDVSDPQIRRFAALKRVLSNADIILLLEIGDTIKMCKR